MTALIDTLFQLEKYLDLELDSLLPYAEADTIGGYHPDEALRKWWTGAIWEVEGQTLYALIRALKPQTIVEIGSGTGCSTNHMAAALLQNYANPATAGHITTIDRGNTPRILDNHESFVTAIPGDGIDYLALLPDNSVDFILEDADHTAHMCYAIGELAKTKLRPGGVLMAHDAVHETVGRDVRAGYDRAGLDLRTYLTDPSDCGWGVWKRPQALVIEMEMSPRLNTMPNHLLAPMPPPARIQGIAWDAPQTDTSPVIDTSVLQAQEDKPPAKAKRTRKAKK